MNFSPEFLRAYEKACVEQLKKYKDYNDALVFWNTWDNYALSIMYLQILHYLWNSQENAFIGAFVELLISIVHPDPSKRPSLQKTKEIFTSFFYNVDINKAENYENILNGFIKNRQQLAIQITKDKTAFDTLVKRYARKF